MLERVPTRTEVYGPYRPRGAAERALLSWMDSYGISVLRPAPWAPPGTSATEADPSMKRVVVERGQGAHALFHECIHIWLSASGFSPEYLSRLPEDLGRRGMAYEYRRLSGLVSAVLEAEDGIRSASGLLALREALGRPEAYGVYRESGGEFRREPFQPTMSGNIVDETVTLGKPRGHGHPMEDFHEFFASSMASLAYDGETFFRNLSRLERAAGSEPSLRELYSRTMELLGAVHQYAGALPDELRAARFPNAARLEQNLSRLGDHLRQERARSQAR